MLPMLLMWCCGLISELLHDHNICLSQTCVIPGTVSGQDMCRYKLLHVVRKHLGALDAAYECVKRVRPDTAQ